MQSWFRCLILGAMMLSGTNVKGDNQWKPADCPLLTKWAGEVDPACPLPEYPRPQLVRTQWMNLNGLWNYAITPESAAIMPDSPDGRILVPFCIESALSGVGKALTPDHALWYQRTFELPRSWNGRRLLLHFGAVDWTAEVWLNGKLVGNHQGGYDPFSFDVTDALNPSGQQLLVIKVLDPTDSNWQPRGKQVLKPEVIWYTAVSGIWQTVWLEPVRQSYIVNLKITPQVEKSQVRVSVNTTGGDKVLIEVLDNGQPVEKAQTTPGKPVAISLPNAKLWSPDSPHLYDMKVTLLNQGAEQDTVQSYFGMRQVSLGKHDGHTRLLLNGKPLFQYGPLDQGWWPDGLYTAPTDEALRYDLELLKKLNMNMLRKHVKVEPARLYYHCDRLGLLVWQDMPSGDKYIGGKDPDIDRTPESAENFENELEAMIDYLHNHPSIIMWVVYNEGWGQWDTERMAQRVKQYDPTRLVNSASGWTDRNVGDVIDIHVYPGPSMRPAEDKRASVLGEFGGLGWPVKNHLWWNKKNWGYRTYGSQNELQQNYLRIARRLPLLIGKGLSAAVYTQTSDVEGEVNGLMTYDRKIVKFDIPTLAKLHSRFYAPPPRLTTLVPDSADEPQQWNYTTQQPPAGWEDPGFDDSKWQSGAGMFGTEGTPGLTPRTVWNTADIWIRREFALSDVPKNDGLLLSVYHDDDADIYINGVPAASLKGWTTSHTLVEIEADAVRSLKQGRNTIAVHCHQTGGGQGIDVGICVMEQQQD